MFSVQLIISKRFDELVGNKLLRKFLNAFGKIFLIEWRKTSGSSAYWAGKSKTRPPEPTRLTSRSGRLRASITRVNADNISKVTVSETDVLVEHGSRVPYAARQEYQKGGARSYLRRSLKWLIDNRIQEFVNAAFVKVWK